MIATAHDAMLETTDPETTDPAHAGTEASDHDANAPGLVLDATNFDPRIHDGMVTILNRATGNHRTFRIKTQRPDATFAPGKRIVSLLVGPSREDPKSWVSFAFVGTHDDGTVDVRLWSKFRTMGASWTVFAKMLANPVGWASKGAKYMVEARCRACGRPLTRPRSIETGLGDICAGRM